jgi:hypothetical protein
MSWCVAGVFVGVFIGVLLSLFVVYIIAKDDLP